MPASLRRRLAPAARYLYRNDLRLLAAHFGTDKWGKHWYAQHYQRFFAPMKRQKINLLEIGVGGYQDSAEGGESLRMWKAYFPKARIVGIDICDKTQFIEPRIDIRQCDQTDADTLHKLSEQYGGFDIIVDDGSHLNPHVIETFKILFPLLRPHGIYAVEDIQTSYWPTWGGGLDNRQSSMAFFKGLTDGLNHVDYPDKGYQTTYFDRHIVEIALFHNLIFIRKGINDETSNEKLLEAEIEAGRHRTRTLP